MTRFVRTDRRGSWEETRRERAQLAWAVLLIDAIAVGLGALASHPMGSFALWVGVGLAIFVTAVFMLLVLVQLAIEALVHRWLDRLPKDSTSPPLQPR